MLKAPNLSELPWLEHGFGLRDSSYPEPITTVKQVHSDHVVVANAAPCEADALLTIDLGTRVGVKTADCVPVLLADTRQRVAAAVHAGWRGTASGITARAVREMAARFGSRPEHVVAAVGPSIGGCCYQVGPDVARQFGTVVTSPIHLDLAAINAQQLRHAGVSSVWIAGECTFCEKQRYFSYRREKEAAGRMISWVGIKA
jgi:YfiH family protein